jgi:hypothetical protein
VPRSVRDFESEIHGTPEAFHDGEKAEQQVPGGEKGGQSVSGTARAAVGGLGIDKTFGNIKARHGLRSPGNNVGTTRNSLPDFHLNTPFASQEHVNP